jgi:CRISPR-associated protein Csb2
VRWLILEARFLTGRYAGQEWPPAPMRLLQAIVAGLRGTDHAALRWLEKQPAPAIVAEREPAQSCEVTTYVPNNSTSFEHEKAPRPRRTRVVEQPVRYAWALPDTAAERCAAELIRLAQAVHTLGTGQDMCAVRGVVEPNPPVSSAELTHWAPNEAHGLVSGEASVLRIPVTGSVAAIEQRWQQGLRRYGADFVPPVLAPALHKEVMYLPSNLVPRHVALALHLGGPGPAVDAPVSWHAGDAVIVAGMLRHACMQATKDGPMANWAAGHAPRNDLGARLSWVPLPSIGAKHADRRIRRALLLARASDKPALAALYEKTAGGLLSLVDEATGELMATTQPLDRDDGVLRAYLGRGRIWHSVTPVALPGDHADAKRAPKLVRKALVEAGIDAGLIANIECSTAPFHPRDVPLSAVKVKAWQAHAVPLRHVRVALTEPLAGPLVIGRGRHYGLGLLCANLE